MASVEGLNAVQGLQDKVNDQMQTQLRQQAAQSASTLFQQGDVKGAIGALAKVDPDHAAQMFGQFQQFDPSSAGALSQAQAQGTTQGKFNVETPAGANPRQLEDAKLKAMLQKQATLPSNQVVRADPNSPTGFSIINKQTGQTTETSKSPLVQTADQPPQLRPNEDINSNGEKVMLNPNQQKIIKETRKSFDEETKDLVKGLEAAHQGAIMVNENVPGAEPLERLRVLKSVVQQKMSNQEFQAFGTNFGAVADLEQRLEKIKTGKMTPEIQKDYLKIIGIMGSALDQEYDQHLKNAVERNPEVDPLILKKRLVGSGPTAYQAIIKHVETLPPEDQAAFNWAHDNSTDPRAKAILQRLTPKK